MSKKVLCQTPETPVQTKVRREEPLLCSGCGVVNGVEYESVTPASTSTQEKSKKRSGSAFAQHLKGL